MVKSSRQIGICGGEGRNMIIMLTGASHTGKTLLAQRMLEKYKYPYISIDHLKMGLIRSGNTALTPEDDDALTDYLWPIVREIIKTAIENKQNMIVEGCYIPFNWRTDFDEIITNESAIEARLIPSDCTIADLKEDNERCINGYQSAGERVVLIDSDYEQEIQELLK